MKFLETNFVNGISKYFMEEKYECTENVKKKKIITILLFLIIFVSMIEAQNRHALLIGISDYGNPKNVMGKWRNINGTNDIELLTPKLIKQGFVVTKLMDSQATHSSIVKSLKDLVKKSKKGNIVYIQFSMHGQPVEDLNGDEEDGWDEALIPYDAKIKYEKGVYEGENHLLDDELEIYFNEIRSQLGPQGKLYVIMDSCHSGTSSRGVEDDDEVIRGVNTGFSYTGKLYKADRTRNNNDYFKVNKKAGMAQVVFLEACRSYEENREIRDRNNVSFGRLSFFIAEIMDNQNITDNDLWLETVKEKVEKLNQGKPASKQQHPVIEKSK